MRWDVHHSTCLLIIYQVFTINTLSALFSICRCFYAMIKHCVQFYVYLLLSSSIRVHLRAFVQRNAMQCAILNSSSCNYIIIDSIGALRQGESPFRSFLTVDRCVSDRFCLCARIRGFAGDLQQSARTLKTVILQTNTQRTQNKKHSTLKRSTNPNQTANKSLKLKCGNTNTTTAILNNVVKFIN